MTYGSKDPEIANYIDPKGPNPEVGAFRNHNSRNWRGVYDPKSYASSVPPKAGGKTTFVVTNNENFFVPGIAKPKKALQNPTADEKLSPKEKPIVFCVITKEETMNPKEAILIPKEQGMKAIKLLVAYAVAGKAIKNLMVEEEKRITGTIIDGNIVLDDYFVNAPVYGQAEKKQEYQGIKNPIKLTLQKENALYDDVNPIW